MSAAQPVGAARPGAVPTDRFAGVGAAPDGDGFVALQHSVVGEERSQSDVAARVGGEDDAREPVRRRGELERVADHIEHVAAVGDLVAFEQHPHPRGLVRRGAGEEIRDGRDAKVDRDVREKLITARVGLLLRASFFGNLATRLKLVNADEWCGTAATDGRHFYYNSRFIQMLRPKEIEFLFGHEVLHCVYDHFGRRGSRDPQLFNIANDFAVNADLIKHRVGEKITTVGCLHDPKYDGLSSEEIYDKLMENVQKISMSDLLDKMIDEHLDGDGDGDGQNGDKEGKGRPKLSDADRQAIKDEIKEAMLAAAQTTDGAGNIPAGVLRLIKDLTEPQMNWRELLRMNLESTIKSDYTWMRPSRRGWHMDAVMPGQKNDEMIDIAIAIDTSGSIGDKDRKSVV